MPEGKPSDLPRSRKTICQQVLPRTLFHLVYFFVVFRGLSSRNHHLQHRHESQKNSGLIDGETLDLVIQNVWLD